MELANQLVLEQCYQEFLNNKGVTLLSSECPGWACYAEKALDEVIIPHMSRVKSPQQVMGSLVKHVLARKLLVVNKKIKTSYLFLMLIGLKRYALCYCDAML